MEAAHPAHDAPAVVHAVPAERALGRLVVVQVVLPRADWVLVYPAVARKG